MPTPSSTSLDQPIRGVTVPLDWNEILIARMHQGELTCWTAWRRSIEAFTDPAVWEDPNVWPRHFKQQPPDAGWGFEGYGLIAVDMDRKHLWSFNDYQDPGSVHLPSTSLVVDDPEKSYAGLRGLVQQPAMWPCLTLLTCPYPAPKDPKLSRQTISLDRILTPGMGVNDAIQRLTQDRGTMLIGDKQHMVLRGTMSMPDWTVSTDCGEDTFTCVTEMLATLHTNGWPAPDWTNVRKHLDEQLEEFDENDEQTARKDFNALQDAWTLTDMSNKMLKLAVAKSPRRS